MARAYNMGGRSVMKLLLILVSTLFSAILTNSAALHIDTGGGRVLPHPLPLGPGLVIPANSDADRSSVPRSLHVPLEPGPVILPGPDTSGSSPTLALLGM